MVTCEALCLRLYNPGNSRARHQDTREYKLHVRFVRSLYVCYKASCAVNHDISLFLGITLLFMIAGGNKALFMGQK